jgi:tripartite ATP-independent transporter DctM subunit
MTVAEAAIALSFIILLILFRMEIAFALGIVTYLWLLAVDESVLIGFQRVFGGLNSFVLLAIPFFLLVGELMNNANITDELVKIANITVGRFRGGLAQVNIITSMLFAGITGAAMADVAALGSVLIPSMEKQGYDVDFSAALTAASSLVGPIIPPSLIIVLYGAVTNTSVGGLFAAAIVPGLLLGVSLMTQTYIQGRRRQFPKSSPDLELDELPSILFYTVIALTTPVIILGGILGGVFTPTEAAAVACLYAAFIGIFIFRSLTVRDIYDSLETTALRTGQLFIIVAFATMLSYILARRQIPTILVGTIEGFGLGSVGFMLLLGVLLIFIGTWLDIGAALIILAPITTEVATELAIHPYQFGVFMTVTLLFGLITPPFGLCLFIASSIGEVPVWDVSVRIVPFYISHIAVVIMIILFPEITLYVPRLFGF